MMLTAANIRNLFSPYEQKEPPVVISAYTKVSPIGASVASVDHFQSVYVDKGGQTERADTAREHVDEQRAEAGMKLNLMF